MFVPGAACNYNGAEHASCSPLFFALPWLHSPVTMAATAVSCASVAVVLPSTRALRPATAAKRVAFVSNGSVQRASMMQGESCGGF